MPKILNNIILALMFIGIIAGSLYLFQVNASRNANFNNTIKTFDSKVKAQAQAELTKLNDLKATYSAQGSLNSTIIANYSLLADALSKTDELFANPDSKNPSLKLPASKEDQAKVNELRIKINDLLKEWHDTVVSIQNQGVNTPNPILVAQANQEVALLNQYTTELQTILNGITPDSGLTQQQINNGQTILDTTQNTIDTASNNINNAASSSGAVDAGNGQIIIPPVTQQDINNQQQIVDQLNSSSGSQSSGTTSTGGSTNSDGSTSSGGTTGTDTNTGTDQGSGSNSGNGGVDYIPPPTNSSSTAPRLIEGANNY